MHEITSDIFETSGFYWSGNVEEGCFSYSNGSGDNLAICWNNNQLVAAVFDHESDRSHIGSPQEPNSEGLTPDQDPRYFFPHFPSKNIELLKTCNKLLEDAGGDTNVTFCLWADKSALYLPESKNTGMDHGLWIIENYINDIEEAVIDPNAKTPEAQKDFYFSALVGDIQAPIDSNAWRFHYSLSPEQARLLIDIEDSLTKTWNVELDSEQWISFKTVSDNLVDPSTGKKKRGTPENFKKIREKLAEIGVTVK